MSRPWLAVARTGFLIAIPVLCLLIVSAVTLYWGMGIAVLGNNFIVLADPAPVPERRMAGLAAALVPTVFMLIALWRLFQIFRETDTSVLGPATVRNLRAFAALSICTVVSAFLLSGVMRWAMGMFDDALLWTHLGFSVVHLSVLFGAMVVYVATHLIEEGYACRRELEEYV
ncbi:MAG: DUF2975 domain-containing protein [Hyphomonas sp.]|uniref:DUF2975 domain-containing protein n=1 Tax=Hyphomonas sp. TaxID=87 RepID=UPI0035275E12